MDHEVDHERDEVYERIPWETLQKGTADRQWIVYAVAGAIAIGALAYSFTRNQPLAPPPALSPPEAVVTASTNPTQQPMEVAPAHSPSTVASPLVMAEADLFAVDPERLLDQATAHAEWFAVEYISADGSDESSATLRSLLPLGLPLPEAPDGTQVFVDWARSLRSTQKGPVAFEIEVLVRSLVSSDSGFTRQPATVVIVTVEVVEDGMPQVTGAPEIEMVAEHVPLQSQLVDVPDEVKDRIDIDGSVVGGREVGDGTWEVVTLVAGPDGVRRPVTVRG